MSQAITRRRILKHAGLAAAASAALSPAGRADNSRPAAVLKGPTFSLTGTRLRIFHPLVQRRVRVMVIADTHLQRDDERGKPHREYSARMARAYRTSRHFATGEETTTEESFRESVEEAKRRRVALILLAGDIVSFPSEAGVEWAVDLLERSGIPYLYTAGNHDWHYEGKEGSIHDLRAEWIRKRLMPFYNGEHPLMHAREVRGVRFLSIDNSTYEIMPYQLDFFRKEAALGKPLVVMMHIPLYMPGRSVGYGCGHPSWSAATDRHYELERRPPWPEGGHTETTFAFRREVLSCPNVVAVVAGHVHRASADVAGFVPQFVAEANFRGGHLDLDIDPPVRGA